MARVDPRRGKVHRSYTIAEAAELLGVHRNTVRHWIKAGLTVVQAGRLHLILGRELRQFLVAKHAQRRRKCGPGQLYCFRCREPRRPADGSIRSHANGQPTVNLSALCASCGARMNQRVSAANLGAFGLPPVTLDAGGEPHSR